MGFRVPVLRLFPDVDDDCVGDGAEHLQSTTHSFRNLQNVFSFASNLFFMLKILNAENVKKRHLVLPAREYTVGFGKFER